MIRRPPRSTLFPTRRSSDLDDVADETMPNDVGLVEVVKADAVDPREDSFDLHQSRILSLGQIDLGFVAGDQDRKSTRLNSSHSSISYAVFCLKKKKIN